MKRKVRFVAIVFFTLITLFFLMNTNKSEDKESVAIIKSVEEIVYPLNPIEPVDLEDVKTDIDNDTLSKYPGLHLKNQTKTGNTYTITTSIPIAESAAINAPIGNWLNSQENEFLKNVDDVKDILSNNNLKAVMNIQVDTEIVAEGIYSLVFNSFTFYNGANGINTTKSFTVDINNNKILQIKNILNLNGEALSDVNSLIEQQIELHEEKYSFIIDELLSEALKKPETWNWSINKEYLTLYFGEYEVAAGAGGTTIFEIPLEDLMTHINGDFAEKVELLSEDNNNEEIDDGSTENETDTVANLDSN